MSLLEVTDLSLTYASDGVVVEALRKVSLSVEAGEVQVRVEAPDEPAEGE